MPCSPFETRDHRRIKPDNNINFFKKGIPLVPSRQVGTGYFERKGGYALTKISEKTNLIGTMVETACPVPL